MVRKVVLTIGLALLLLSLLAYLIASGSLLTRLRNALVKTIVTYASQSLQGTLEVGALQGSLFSSPVLLDVVLRDAQGNVVGQIDEVRLAYDLTTLLKKRLTIHEIALVRPQLTVAQEADGRLNLSHLLSPSPAEGPATPEQPAPGSGLPLPVVLERLQIRDGQFDLHLPSLPGVQRIQGLQLSLSAQLDQEGMRAQLQELTASMQPADVHLHTQGAFQALAGVTQIDDLRLQLGHTLLTLTGVLPGSPQPASLALQLHPLDVGEIGRLLQNDALHGQLQLSVTVEGPPDALVIASHLSPIGPAEAASIDVRGEINTLATPPRYRSTLDITKLDLAAWVERAALQSEINLHMRAEGEGLSPAELRSQLQIEIQPSHLGSIALRPSHIELEARSGRFQVQRFNLDTSVARMTATGALDLAGRSDVQYEVAADLAGLQPLLDTQALDGTLQLQGDVTGEWPALSARGVMEARTLLY
ncbi:MAG: AsmA family protein, partial [Candidatus Entotheonellia bacterium]